MERLRSYIATADIFNQLGVDFGFLEDFLEDGVKEEVEFGILESSLECLCQWRTDCEGNDNIIGVFGGAVECQSACVCLRRGWPYIADSPEEPGVRCLRIELSLSAAMMKML